MNTFLFAGCGSIGRRHIQNLKTLLPDARILAYRVRNEPLAEFGQKFGVKSFSNLESALDQKPDAVFVTNPTSLHLQTAALAAERGIPLFIEKPLSHNMNGIDNFISICEKQSLLVMVGYKMRFHPSLVRIKKLLDENVVGRPLSLRAHYGGCLAEWHSWEDYRRMYSARRDLGGGVVLDAIHELDYAYWLLGDSTVVSSLGGKLSDLEIETEDMAEILLRFKNGALGSIHLNYVQYPESRFCQIIGTEGTITWDSLSARVGLYKKTEKKWDYFPEPRGWTSNQLFLDEMQQFLNCLAGKEKPLHTLRDAKRVLEIALQAKKGLVPQDGSASGRVA